MSQKMSRHFIGEAKLTENWEILRYVVVLIHLMHSVLDFQ